MNIPLQVSFRNMDPPLGIEDHIRSRTMALHRFYSRITDCRVVIERRNHRHRKGDLFHLLIDVSVPGARLVVSRDPPGRYLHENLLLAVHDAFDEMRRQLEDHAREMRSATRRQAAAPPLAAFAGADAGGGAGW